MWLQWIRQVTQLDSSFVEAWLCLASAKAALGKADAAAVSCLHLSLWAVLRWRSLLNASWAPSLRSRWKRLPSSDLNFAILLSARKHGSR